MKTRAPKTLTKLPPEAVPLCMAPVAFVTGKGATRIEIVQTIKQIIECDLLERWDSREVSIRQQSNIIPQDEWDRDAAPEWNGTYDPSREDCHRSEITFTLESKTIRSAKAHQKHGPAYLIYRFDVFDAKCDYQVPEDCFGHSSELCWSDWLPIYQLASAPHQFHPDYKVVEDEARSYLEALWSALFARFNQVAHRLVILARKHDPSADWTEIPHDQWRHYRVTDWEKGEAEAGSSRLFSIHVAPAQESKALTLASNSKKPDYARPMVDAMKAHPHPVLTNQLLATLVGMTGKSPHTTELFKASKREAMQMLSKEAADIEAAYAKHDSRRKHGKS